MVSGVYITTQMRREADRLQKNFQNGYKEAQRLLREGADHIDALDRVVNDMQTEEISA